MADLGDLINAGTAPVNVANANLINQQAQGAALQNQGTQIQLDYRKQFLQQMAQQAQTGTDSGVAVPGSSDGDFALDEAHARAYLQNKYQPVPNTWSQADMAQRAAAMASGVPGAQDFIVAQHDARIANINGQRQQAARKEYSDLYGVATSDPSTPGSALEALRVSQPQVAAYFESQGWTDDDAIRAHAAQLAGLTHASAQLPVKFRDDGVAVDEATQEEIPNYDSAVGLKAKDRADLMSTYNGQVEVTNSDGSTSKIPLWQKDGFKSADDAVQHVTRMAQQHGVPGAAVPGVVARGVAARSAPPAQAPAPGAAPGAPAPAPTAAPAGAPPARPAAAPPQAAPARQAAVIPGSPQAVKAVLATVPPAQRAAYTDPDFRAQGLPGPTVANQSPSLLQQEATKKYVADRAELNTDMRALTDSSSQALQYIQAAKAVLASGPSPPTGLTSGVQAAFSRAMQAAGITQGDYATRYQELAKYLGNVAVQNFKANFGARPAAKEFDIQMSELNPNAHMTDQAVRDMLAVNERAAQYGIASAQRAPKYLAAGLEPGQFPIWNQKYNPREEAVNPPPVPRYNKQGWELHTDPKGRQAYVSPDGKSFAKVGQ